MLTLGLARFADRGPVSAAGLAAALLSAGLLLLLTRVLLGLPGMALVILSGAVVSYVVLRYGEVLALQTLALCTAGLALLGLWATGSLLVLPIQQWMLWLPPVLAAAVLRRTVNLNLAVLLVVGMGLALLLLLRVLVPDLDTFWYEQLAMMFSTEALPAGVSEQDLDQLLRSLAGMATGAAAMSLMTLTLGSLFLARAWQAALHRPGGFREEFHALRFGRAMALAGMVIMVVSMLSRSSLGSAAAFVVLFGFFVQGMAVVHALVQQRGMNRGWLVGLYVLLILPHTVLLVGALGLADNLFGFRRDKPRPR